LQKGLNEPLPIAARDGLLALFEAAPVVALGEAHWVEEEHRLIRELLLDERFAETVDAIVVEFGNAIHQPVIDRYLAGEAVAPSELRRVWAECVGGAGSRVFESPVYPAFFETVRSVRRGRSEFPRVLLGDPPFDWQRGADALEHALGDRDDHFARLVEREILARGLRGLLLAGAAHFGRVSDLAGDGNVVQRLEREAPGCCVVVLPHYVFEDVAQRRPSDVAELEARLAGWPVPALAMIRGTWLGEIDAALLFGDTARRIEPDGTELEVPAPFLDDEGRPRERVTLAEVADAYLYLGPTASLTLAEPPLR
jgi:hypothetical protein